MYRKKSNTVSTKVLVLIVALTLVVGVTAGGTLAWLLDKTDTVTNTFTTSNVDIILEETDAENNAKSFQMIPGYTITKDPKVTVIANSEKCYVFVKLEKSDNTYTVTVDGTEVTKKFEDYLNYEVAEGWTQGSNENDVPTNVWFRIVDKSDTNQPFYVIKDNNVKVLDTVTNAMMEAAKNATPTLKVTAYASQYYKNNDTTVSGADDVGTPFTVVEAWNNVTAPSVTKYEPTT